jgi:endonuclease/exonuclease/phosphatase family metal-dependent hydrolase
MGSARIFRLFEGSLVVLFFIQATRVAFAMLLSMVGMALTTGQAEAPVVYSHLILLAMLIPAWFAPRIRSTLPVTLMTSAVLIAVARIVISLPFGISAVRLYASLAVMGLAGVYCASLLRANRRSWLVVLVVGLAADQLFRARDTFDFSLRLWFDLPVADLKYRIPLYVIQIVLSLCLVAASILARRMARLESYEPAFLTPLGGLALGSFFALETVLLAMPNVIARWTETPYTGIVPWLLLATTLPLVPAVRNLMGQTLTMFEDRSRGWVWLFVFLLVVVVGNRLGGFGAAGALIVAQFIAVLLLWWIPVPPDPAELEQVGPSIALGWLVYALLIYAYSFTFEYARVFTWLRTQGLVVVLITAALLGLSRLPWREDDPWLESALHKGVSAAFVIPVVVLGLILSAFWVGPVEGIQSSGETLRVATYNINGGYDELGNYQLELAARTIEASVADVVVLQEGDAGRPVSYGVDQVRFLARRLGMAEIYYPTTEQVQGIAILSRWPVSEQSGVLLPGGGEQRAAVRGLLQDASSGRSVTVIGALLAPGSEEERLEQLAVLVTLIGEDTPLVLAADLAGTPQELVYQQLVGSGFLDPDSMLGIERGFTTPAQNPTARHDYVLVRDLVPLDARQVDSTASDHRLVVVEVGWP